MGSEMILIRDPFIGRSLIDNLDMFMPIGDSYRGVNFRDSVFILDILGAKVGLHYESSVDDGSDIRIVSVSIDGSELARSAAYVNLSRRAGGALR